MRFQASQEKGPTGNWTSFPLFICLWPRQRNAVGGLDIEVESRQNRIPRGLRTQSISWKWPTPGQCRANQRAAPPSSGVPLGSAGQRRGVGAQKLLMSLDKVIIIQGCLMQQAGCFSNKLYFLCMRKPSGKVTAVLWGTEPGPSAPTTKSPWLSGW